MKLFLCITLAVGLIAAASALTCKTCSFRALSMCFHGSGTEQNCAGNCSMTKAVLGDLTLFSKQNCAKDCVETKNGTDNLFNFQYSISCCTTDQCNSGNSVKISLSLGLAMGLLWLLKAV